ncbi:MAG: polysaccharide deacetylase family protein [Bacteroidales bacterium]|nr:polysaccharide deacetylase family protein [Bacteroidales bacterium]
MRSICFYFQVHQPFRLKTYRFFDIGANHFYFDEYRNRYIMRRIADKCYLPMNNLLLDLIKEYGSAFKVSFSLSGTVIDQFERYAPDVLESYIKLAETGCVEFLAETFSHSLSSLKSDEEFNRQVSSQVELVKRYFKQEPTTFRNTELIYSDTIGAAVANMGYRTMLTEGAKHIMGWKSPNYLYCNSINPKLKLLLKNFRLSDDIAFRFSQQSWNGWPLTTEKFVNWIQEIDSDQETINLFMDYETFGEHQWPETGIFEFMKTLPATVFARSNYGFYTPAELSEKLQPRAAIYVPNPISWADEERDLTAWLGNDLQNDAFNKLYDLEYLVKNTPDQQIQLDWKYLQTSDHFYYMCTKWFSDGDVHKYFNPFNSPYEAYINFMNILSDFIIRLKDMHLVNRVEVQEQQAPREKTTIKKTAKTKVARVKTAAKKTTGAAGVKKTKTADKASAAKTVVTPATKTKSSGTTKVTLKDVLTMKKTDLTKLVKDIDLKTLYCALVGADNKVKKSIITHLGKLQLKSYNKLFAENLPVSDSDVEKAQKVLLARIKQLLA